MKPAIFKNAQLARLGGDTFRLFEGLWCMADRQGRLKDEPEKIEAEIFPFKFQAVKIDELLAGLAVVPDPFIVRYEVDAIKYIQIVNFSLHQNPHHQEVASRIPPCKKGFAPTTEVLRNNNGTNPADSHSLTPDSRLPITSGAVAQKSKRFIPPTAAEATAYALSIGFRLDGEEFVAHYEARGWKYGPGRPMASWQAAVVTWKKKAVPWQIIKAAVRTPMKSHALPPEPDATPEDSAWFHWIAVKAMDGGRCRNGADCQQCKLGAEEAKKRDKENPDVR